MIICPWKDIMRYAAVIPGLEEAVERVNALENLEPATYPLENGRFFIAKGTTRSVESVPAEVHRNYLDIQYVVEGEETMGWAPTDQMTLEGEFNVEGDCGMYVGPCQYVKIPAGTCYVVFPEDAHKPGRHLDEPTEFVKVVVKLKV